MIKTGNLSYTYKSMPPSEKQALSDVNIKIADGTLAALIGHTGSGKSTLIQLLGALIKPTSGRVIIDGTDITAPKADTKNIRRDIGIVFQYPEHQLFEETVYKDIAFAPKNFGLSDAEIKERVHWAADAVGLSEKYLDASPFELSGGEKRRAAIAGVIAAKPKILILDEPTAGLDPRGRDDIFALLRRLHGERRDMIIIFATHSMEDAARYSERVIVMNEGRVETEGSTAEVFSNRRRLREIGLEVPQITVLTDKLREMGYALPESIFTVADAAEAILKLTGGGFDA